VVDIREVVAGNLARHGVNPDFTAQLSISSLIGNFVRLINDLAISNDLTYHDCSLCCSASLTAD
jgi:hypothetical protein